MIAGITGYQMERIGIPDTFVEHGPAKTSADLNMALMLRLLLKPPND